MRETMMRDGIELISAAIVAVLLGALRMVLAVAAVGVIAGVVYGVFRWIAG